MKPIISVCIPTYNNLVGLQRALKSLADQTFQNFEVVISDDSTTADIANYLDSVTFSFPIIYKRHKPGLGSPENWNAAIAMASGAYIKILHHDDWFATNKALDIFFTAMQQTGGKGFIFCNSINVYAGGKKSMKRPSKFFLKKLAKDPYLLFFGNFIGSPSAVFFPRNGTIEFDNHTRWYVDVIFYVAFLRSNNSCFRHINQGLVHVTAGDPTQLTQRIDVNEKFSETLYLFNKYLPVKSRYRFLLGVTLIEQIKEYGLNKAQFAVSGYRELENSIKLMVKLPLPAVFFSAIRNLILRLGL